MKESYKKELLDLCWAVFAVAFIVLVCTGVL